MESPGHARTTLHDVIDTHALPTPSLRVRAVAYPDDLNFTRRTRRTREPIGPPASAAQHVRPASQSVLPLQPSPYRTNTDNTHTGTVSDKRPKKTRPPLAPLARGTSLFASVVWRVTPASTADSINLKHDRPVIGAPGAQADGMVTWRPDGMPRHRGRTGGHVPTVRSVAAQNSVRRVCAPSGWARNAQI